MFAVIIECSHCSDTGVCIVEMFDGGTKMPMRCDCVSGRDTAWKLPRWSDAFKPRACRIEFPHAWFQPKEGIAGIFGQKMEQWKAKIRLAEEFWEHNETSEGVK